MPLRKLPSTGIYAGLASLTPKLISVTRLGAFPLLSEDVTALTGTLACDHAHQFINPIR